VCQQGDRGRSPARMLWRAHSLVRPLRNLLLPLATSGRTGAHGIAQCDSERSPPRCRRRQSLNLVDPCLFVCTSTAWSSFPARPARSDLYPAAFTADLTLLSRTARSHRCECAHAVLKECPCVSSSLFSLFLRQP